MKLICPECGELAEVEEWEDGEHSTVYLLTCHNCGYVEDDE